MHIGEAHSNGARRATSKVISANPNAAKSCGWVTRACAESMAKYTPLTGGACDVGMPAAAQGRSMPSLYMPRRTRP